ncbi:hypothetical protein CVS40_2607 [Lucilia cuprina]|nr:hypothetical protein CVS40_2607 [Lucilia cuprina]
MLIKQKFVYLSLTILLIESLAICAHAKSLPYNATRNGRQKFIKSKSERSNGNILFNEPILYTLPKQIQISSKSQEKMAKPYMNDVEYDLRLRQLMEELVLRSHAEKSHDIGTDHYIEKTPNKEPQSSFSHNPTIEYNNIGLEPQKKLVIKDLPIDYDLLNDMAVTKNLTNIANGNTTSSADAQKIQHQLEFLQKNAENFKQFQQVQERTNIFSSQTQLNNVIETESNFNNQSLVMKSKSNIQNNVINDKDILHNISSIHQSNTSHGNPSEKTQSQALNALMDTNISQELSGPKFNYTAPISLKEFLKTINMQENRNVEEKSSVHIPEFKILNHMNNFANKNNENSTKILNSNRELILDAPSDNIVRRILNPNTTAEMSTMESSNSLSKLNNIEDLLFNRNNETTQNILYLQTNDHFLKFTDSKNSLLTKQNMESIMKNNIVTTEVNLERPTNTKVNMDGIPNKTQNTNFSQKYLEMKTNIPLLDKNRNISQDHHATSVKDTSQSNHNVSAFINDENKPNISSKFKNNSHTYLNINITKDLDHLSHYIVENIPENNVKTTSSMPNTTKRIFEATENSMTSIKGSRGEHLNIDIAQTNTAIDKNKLTHFANELEKENNLIKPMMKDNKDLPNENDLPITLIDEIADLTTETPHSDTTLSFNQSEHLGFSISKGTSQNYKNYFTTESPENTKSYESKIDDLLILKEILNLSNKINSEENHTNQLVTKYLLATESQNFMNSTEQPTTSNIDGGIYEGVNDIKHPNTTFSYLKNTANNQRDHINDIINNTNAIEKNINHTSIHTDFRILDEVFVNHGILNNKTEDFSENRYKTFHIDQTTELPYYEQLLNNETEYTFTFNDSSELQDQTSHIDQTTELPYYEQLLNNETEYTFNDSRNSKIKLLN